MALNLKKLSKGRDLTLYDLIVLIDTSGSMSGKDTPSGLSRLDDSKKMVGVLVKGMGDIDTDGITIACFDTSVHDVYENTTDARAQAVLAKAQATGGGTYHDKALSHFIDPYLEALLGKPAVKGTKGGLFSKGTPDVPAVPGNPKTKPIVIVCITDGEPSNGQASVEAVIVNATKRLTAAGYTRDRLGISFIQTGRDKGAQAFLDRLNNGLSARGATLDIVNSLTIDDTVGLNAEEILTKALDD